MEKGWSYDPADRVQDGADITTTVAGTDDAGDPVTSTSTSGGGAYGYDQLGRVTTLPAADAPSSAGAGGGAVTIGYYDTDAAHTLTEGGISTSYTLDPAGRRSLSTVTTDGADTVTTTRHYGDDSDDPSFATQTTGTGSPAVSVYGDSIGGDLGVTITGGNASLALADPHGDTVTTLDVSTDGSTPQLSSPVLTFDEYGNRDSDLNQTQVDADGNPIDTTSAPATGALAYGYLGAKERALDTTGLQLMGARLYNPMTGRFTSADPVPGGSCNAYDYVCGDPVNLVDLDGRMAVAALVAVALPTLTLGQVILVVGAAFLAGIVIYAIWHGRSAAIHKLRSTYHTMLNERSKHSKKRKGERGISDDMIDQAIRTGKKSRGNKPGTTKHTGRRIIVITNSRTGKVVSVICDVAVSKEEAWTCD